MGTQSEQLEREAHHTRARLTDTLEELRARMTAGQVVDQLRDYVRQGPAAEFVGNLAREVRQNPLPLTLIAVGVAWLIIASTLSSRSRRPSSDVEETVEASAALDAGSIEAQLGPALTIPPTAAPEYASGNSGGIARGLREPIRCTNWQDARAMEQAYERQ